MTTTPTTFAEGDPVRIRRGHSHHGTPLEKVWPELFDLSGKVISSMSPGSVYVRFEGDVLGRTVPTSHLEPLPPYEVAKAFARDLGREHGRNAASWAFDGNSDETTYRAVLEGIEAGDPEVFDIIPTADLSGEWADTLTGPDLAQQAAEASGMASWAAGGDMVDVFFQEVCDAYEEAFNDTAAAEIEKACRLHLA